MQMSDWMKVMLEEVERKQAEEAEAREEFERRQAAQGSQAPAEPPAAAGGPRTRDS
jgi:Xaa-Pro aminopeptidase